MSRQLKNNTGERKLRVTLLSAGWKASSNGDSTTINRELATQMAKHPNVEVSVFLPQCSEEDKKDADSYNVKLIEAVRVPGLKPVLWLACVPDGHAMDCVLGHGVALGQQILLIKRNPNYSHCKWIQVIHTAPEEIGMFKSISEGQQMQQTEIELCEMADQVVTIGPKLTDAYKRQLRKQDVFNLTPSILTEFSDVQQASEERRTFCVLVTESGNREDFDVKGYDIAMKAIANLKDKSYQLKFASKERGKEDELADKLLQCGIGRNQLIICSFDENRETLANLLSAVDIAILPSKTEGFGLSSLEAISAGLPVLVSGNSGIAEALREVPNGSQCIVDSEDPADWARAIKAVRDKKRKVRLAEAKILRENYLQQFSWEEPCNFLVKKMYSLAFGVELNVKVDVDDLKPEEQNMQTGMLAIESVRCQEVQQPRTSATSAASGSVSDPQTEDLKALKEKTFLSIITNSFYSTKPQSIEEWNWFKEFAKEMKVTIIGVSEGSLVITVRCESLMILEELWTDYSSGRLDEVVQNCFVTEKILKELNLAELRLKTTMDKEEYNACKMFFEKDALRGALSSEFHSTSSTSESPQKKEQWEKSEQKTKIVETVKSEGILPPHGSSTSDPQEKLEELLMNLKKQVTCSICLDTFTEPKILSCHHTFCCECLERHARVSQRQEKFRCPECQVEISLPEGNCFDCLPNSFLHKSLLSVLQAESCEGTSPSNIPFTASHKKKWEVRHSTGKFQEKEGSSSPSLLSTTDLEEKIGKVCEDIKMLRMEGSSPPPMSTVEVELEELVKKLQKGRLEASSPPPLLSTIDLEEKLGKVCKEIKMLRMEGSSPPPASTVEVELEELLKKLQKGRLEGSSPPPLLSTTDLEEKLGKVCEEIKMLRMKGSSPLPVSTVVVELEEQQEELLEKLQKGRMEGALSSEFHSTSSTSESPQKKEQWEKIELKTKIMGTAKLEGTSPLTVVPTTGYGKELEEPWGRKGALSSEFHSISSTCESPQNQEELKKRKQKTKIDEKGSFPVLKFSTICLEETLAALCKLLQMFRMEVTLPSPELLTADLEEKLKELLTELERQRDEGTLPPTFSTIEVEVDELLKKFQKRRMEGALSSEFHSTSSTSESPLTKEQWEKSEQQTKIMETAKLEGVSSSEFHSISSTSESPQNQEELKKGKQKTKIVEREKMKGTLPLTVIPTTGHGKELIGKAQGRKGMLPPFGSSISDPEEELEELHMKLQIMKGSSSPPLLSTIDLEEKLGRVCRGLKMLRVEGGFFVLQFSTIDLEEKLAELSMDLQRSRMIGILLPPEFFIADLEDDLERLREKLNRLRMTGRSHPFVSTIEVELGELLKQLRKWWKEVTSSPSDMFTTGYEREQKELPKAMRLQERKEFSTRNNKISVSKSEITEEGGVLMVQNVPSRVMIPPKALPTCTEVTCSLWNQQILSPPLGRNEALVSSVMELACGNLPGTEERYEFNVKVKVALSHSASDIKGYELVIKELTNEKTNDWRDLKTRWAWTPSDIKDEHSGVDEFPDWLFPFAEAEITSFSSFAVVWRLKSFTFKNPSTLSSSFPCILSDHPGVSVTFPESSLPTGQTFALTVQVQEVPCSNAKLKEPPVVGPILHISTSEPVQLLAPARLTIPVTLREDIPKCLDYSATDVRIFCRTSEEDEREWNEVTEQLENIAVLENGTVTFTVNHFSEHWVWIDRLKLPFVTLKNLADDFCRRLMLQEVGFFARLYATENPSIYVLTLFCFPLHLREQVQTLSPDSRRVCAQGGGNSRKPLCKEDWMSVSLSNAFTLQEGNPYNLLKFLGTYPYEGSLRVSISDLSNLQAELYMEEQFNRDTLCTLYFVPTFPDQSSSPRNFPSTVQVAMPEQNEDENSAMLFQVAMESSTAPEETASNNFSKENLKVTILADEWNSLKGGLSTINRELAIHLASRSDTQVTFLVPHGACGLEEKAAAAKNCVSIIEAKKLIACPSPIELFFPPKDLGIDVVIGHGVKLGQQAQIIRESHDCKWVQVVHTAPDELGMYKDYPKAIAQSEEKNQREVSLCEIADLVMAVGPKLKGFYSNHLRSFNKDQNVVEFTPGIMRDLIDMKLSPNENDEFQVLMFGRGDDEDFKLKGYDIAVRAFASHELKNDSYHLTFVGAAPGKQGEFAAKVLQHGISENQLSVKEYIKDRNQLKELLLRMDLVIMPSRAEGFGLTALEALSAGLPVLAGHKSGFSKALLKVEFGGLCVVNSDKPEDWSKAIKNVRQKERKQRLNEMQRVRESYGQRYNWAEQCEILIREMRRKVFA